MKIVSQVTLLVAFMLLAQVPFQTNGGPLSRREGTVRGKDTDTIKKAVDDDDKRKLSDHDHDHDFDDDGRNLVSKSRQEIQDEESCPIDEDLSEYWNCLVKSTMAFENPEEVRLKREADAGPPDIEEIRVMMAEDENEGAKSRVKRQTILRSVADVNDAFAKNFPLLAKLWAYTVDLQTIMNDWNTNPMPMPEEPVPHCQREEIFPGKSFKHYLECLQKQKETRPILTLEDERFVPKPAVVPKVTYDFNLFQVDPDHPDNAIVAKNPDASHPYTLQFEYEPLQIENDRAALFSGADPFVEEQKGVYRYRSDNLLGVKQKNPAWSYTGLHPGSDWNRIKVEKFMIPLLDGADLEKAFVLSDLAETYPGLGEISNAIDELASPMDFTWYNDKGDFAQNRYLIPILTENDLLYYKFKKIIKEEDVKLKVKPDKEVVQDIITALESYLTDIDNVGDLVQAHQNARDISEVKYLETYRQFIYHYYGGLDYSNVLIELERYIQMPSPSANLIPNLSGELQLLPDYDIIRLIYKSYVQQVLQQEKCVYQMISTYDYKREDEDQEYLVEDAKDSGNCPFDSSNGYEESLENFIPDLYTSYFDRKEARQAYSLPLYPNRYPICKHAEPSPIDINTKVDRKSALRDYIFGSAGYRLNRFFMMLPDDGTPLLTVGILNGERLDDSSVRLTGGAVKGEHLTFQYMFLHFSHHWKQTGSEHFLNGAGEPMEIQMLFTIAGSADEVKYWHILARVQNKLFQYRGKLVVILSVLVKVVESDRELLEKAKESGQDPFLFEPLAQAAFHLRKTWDRDGNSPRGFVSQQPTFRLVDFIPQQQGDFYTYRGSLTWPPCFGYVVWSVYEKPLYISKRQFDQFALIPAFGITDTGLLSDNRRTFDQIYVEEEEDPHLNYASKKALQDKRTINRLIVKGTHYADTDHREDDGIVDHEGYFSQDDGQGTNNAISVNEGPAVDWVLLLNIIIMMTQSLVN